MYRPQAAASCARMASGALRGRRRQIGDVRRPWSATGARSRGSRSSWYRWTMDTTTLSSLADLSDQDLLARVMELAADERRGAGAPLPPPAATDRPAAPPGRGTPPGPDPPGWRSGRPGGSAHPAAGAVREGGPAGPAELQGAVHRAGGD